ncbi:hypothetical protein HBDW_24000 [Herbaspirillum sp. DW155]|uniref:hypothetical protein n=1 Tax=Herbaspirillum sp. DW155 TaxID=3095609 RepID=UPI0030857450|nr:hypothetical protein HBDW_24000 [Herbaspirillum sp. DW155]
MRNIKALIAAVLLVGFASSVVAAPRLSSGLRINPAKDDNACLVYDGGEICN